MASILLDPHHQPSNPTLAGRAAHAPRHQRGTYQGVIEETLEDESEVSDAGRQRQNYDEEAYESGGALDESAWQTSPARTLSRENSAAEGGGPADAGVVRMIYQFNQAQLNRRPGGVL
jgi:autophagy-related protein 9